MAEAKLVKIVFDDREYWLLWHWERALSRTRPLDDLLYCSGPFASIADAEKAVTPGWTLVPFQPVAHP
jgi:hypothetical protein